MKKPFQSIDISKHTESNGTYQTYSCFIKSHTDRYQNIIYHNHRYRHLDIYDLKTQNHKRFSFNYLDFPNKPNLNNIYTWSENTLHFILRTFESKSHNLIGIIKSLESQHWRNHLIINEYHGDFILETFQFYLSELAIQKQTQRSGLVKLYLDIEIDSINNISDLAESFETIKKLEEKYAFTFEDYRIKTTERQGVIIRVIFIE